MTTIYFRNHVVAILAKHNAGWLPVLCITDDGTPYMTTKVADMSRLRAIAPQSRRRYRASLARPRPLLFELAGAK